MQALAERIFRSYWFSRILFFCIFYSLFSEAIRINLFNRSADIAFNVIYIMVLVVFIMDITLQWPFDIKYRLSIFFWIDILSLLMIVYDFPWVQFQMYL